MNLLEESGCVYVAGWSGRGPVGIGVEKNTSILPERA